jgi:hypothetical protein
MNSEAVKLISEKASQEKRSAASMAAIVIINALSNQSKKSNH